MKRIKKEEVINSIAAGFQFISCYHPPDFIRAMHEAYKKERSVPAKNAMAQILINSRLAAEGKRPLCQDTGLATVFLKIGMDVRWETDQSIEAMVNEGIRRAYENDTNPLRASIVVHPLGKRRNTGDNTPGVIHTQIVPGDKVDIFLSAKGFGSENKARLLMLNPNDDFVEAVVNEVQKMGAGWCPPGILGVGVGGSSEKAMLLAKEALLEPINIQELMGRKPANEIDTLRLVIYKKINELGIGAQGLGGLSTVLDVKIKEYPTHAAGLPVALIPNCAATRHLHFQLDGSGEAEFVPPKLSDWPEIALPTDREVITVDLSEVTREKVKTWKAGQTLYLTGKLLTGRDAAHKRIADLVRWGEPLPGDLDLRDRFLYYVGPVPKAGVEIIGPAGPTTSNRMDPYTDLMLGNLGLLGMIGKAERGPEAIQSIRQHSAVYLIAVGGAAFLISRSIKSAKVVAFEDLGMEAVHEFEVEEMPVVVAVDAEGNSIHNTGPALWRQHFGEGSETLRN